MTEVGVRVLIVDDDPFVRSGLRLILGGAPDIEVVGEAADGSEVPAAVDRDLPDVVLMDVRMPRLDGVEATKRLRESRPGVKVIVLTTFDTDDLVVQALRAGAAGFLLKDTPPDQIVAAVHAAVRGDPTLSPSVTARLVERVRQDEGDDRERVARTRLDALTERELDVAVAIGEGLANAEIAQRLHMSVATVKAHVSHVLTKLDATNRVQVAIAVHDAGLA